MKQRYYKTVINLGYWKYDTGSRIYEIEDGRSTILPGLKYSLIILLLGWWGGIRGIGRALRALGVNFTGGVDMTLLMLEDEYNDRTNIIWNNLSRKTTEKMNRDHLQLILGMQIMYGVDPDHLFYTKENIDYLTRNLNDVDVNQLRKEEITDVFNAIIIYEKYHAE